MDDIQKKPNALPNLTEPTKTTPDSSSGTSSGTLNKVPVETPAGITPPITSEPVTESPSSDVAVSTPPVEPVNDEHEPAVMPNTVITSTPDPVMANTPTFIAPAPKASVFNKASSSKWVIVLIVGVIISIIACLGGYFAGKQTTPRMNKVTNLPVVDQPLAVPPDATIISQCAIGRGTQYAKPKDLPFGPVYNFYKGKVIGIEFMVGKDDLLTQNKNFLNQPLLNQKYDHVNIGLLSQGHSGFASPHYHVDIMMAPKTVTDEITCKT